MGPMGRWLARGRRRIRLGSAEDDDEEEHEWGNGANPSNLARTRLPCAA
jgi:hypothetical protein